MTHNRIVLPEDSWFKRNLTFDEWTSMTKVDLDSESQVWIFLTGRVLYTDISPIHRQHPEPGSLYYSKVKRTMYVYDIHKGWIDPTGVEPTVDINRVVEDPMADENGVVHYLTDTGFEYQGYFLDGPLVGDIIKFDSGAPEHHIHKLVQANGRVVTYMYERQTSTEDYGPYWVYQLLKVS